MKLKSTLKKYTIAGVICFIVIAAVVTGLIFAYGNRGQDAIADIDAGQNSAGMAADSGAAEGAAVGEGQGAAGQEQTGASIGEQGSSGQAGATAGASGEGQTPANQADEERPGVTRINVYSTDRDLDRIIKLYAEKHWDFDYTVNFYTDASTYSSVDIVSMASEALISGDGSKLDMYCFPAAYAPQYIKGEYSNFACTYKELGIDVDTALRKADIPECLIEDGSNPDGELIALPYLAETTLFMYRRSVAKEVFGTDDPDRIAAIIGAGTQKWDKFIEAAKKLRKNGYYIVPGFRDLEYMLDTSPAFITGPVESFEADPEWVRFLDVSKYLLDNDYIKYTKPWFDEWRDDLNGKNDKVFGFVTYSDVFQFMWIEETAGDWAVCIPPFNTRMPNSTGILVSKNSPNKELLGPLVEWITLDGSEDGYQYRLANGESGFLYNNEKLSVSSGAVMKKVDGSRSILGGQNINPLVYDALKGSKGLHRYIYNELNIYGGWMDKIQALIDGETDRDTAIADYVNQIREAGKVKPVWDHSLDERVFFKDKGVEMAVRSQLGMPLADFNKSYFINVTELDLSGRNIKSLEDIVHFKDLTKLYCSNNQISDISYLKGLKRLRKLDLSDNMISDICGLGDLTDLRELDLSNNKISDISSLKGLSRLETLYLIGNDISDISSLKGLPSLETLYLCENEITSTNGLGGQENLKVLDISKNKVRDIRSLSGLKSLKELLMTDNAVSDINSLKGLKELERLTMYNNQVTDIGSISGMPKLKSIQAGNNEITDISNLSRLPALEHLYLSDNKISDIDGLAVFRDLRTLELANNRISDISSLAKLQKLEDLNLAFNKISDISSLKKMTSLDFLNLSGNNITDRSPVDHVGNVHWNQIITPPANYYEVK